MLDIVKLKQQNKFKQPECSGQVDAQVSAMLEEFAKIRDIVLDFWGEGSKIYEKWLGPTVINHKEIVGLVIETLDKVKAH